MAWTEYFCHVYHADLLDWKIYKCFYGNHYVWKVDSLKTIALACYYRKCQTVGQLKKKIDKNGATTNNTAAFSSKDDNDVADGHMMTFIFN